MERERLTLFVARDYSRVVAAVAYACGDRASAEDAVQEARAAAWLRSTAVEDLPAWVAVTAMNRARSAARRLAAERRAHLRAVRRSSTAPQEDERLDHPVVRELRRLPRRQREVVVLHYLLDRSVDEVAAMLRVTPGTVKTQLHRARLTLAGRLPSAAHLEEENHVR